MLCLLQYASVVVVVVLASVLRPLSAVAMAAGMKEAGGELAGGVKGAGSGVAGGVTNAGSAAKRGSVKE